MEEKLFELMAQAEDLQNHAAKLQNEAQEVFSALPLAVEQGRAENTLYGAANGLNPAWGWYHCLWGIGCLHWLEYG